MIEIARVGLAVPGAGREPSFAGLALLAYFARNRFQVQYFRSRACPLGMENVRRVTGLPCRHLDSWLMSSNDVLRLFEAGTRHADLAVVEGALHPEETFSGVSDADCPPGRLDKIAEILKLPIIAVVSCASGADFHLHTLKDSADAILLDGLPSAEDYRKFASFIGHSLRKPVIGGVLAPRGREVSGVSPFVSPLAFAEGNLGEYLAEHVVPGFDIERFISLSEADRLSVPSESARPARLVNPRIAYAHDEAFGGFFPDTLEHLRALGAELVSFSPLRDAALPEDVDLVMIACGHPERHADRLLGNLSMISSLRAHVCRGRRIFSEGGGTAYLSRKMVLPDREVLAAGILPLVAEYNPGPVTSSPTVIRLARESWLGPAGASVRGYRTNRWAARPASLEYACPSSHGSLTDGSDLFFHHHAIGGFIHMHFAGLAEVIDAFSAPHRPSLKWPTADIRV